MKRVRLLIIFAFIAIFLSTFVSWATQVLHLNIVIAPESSLPNGQAATVTALSDNVAVKVGNSELIEGVGLFQIDAGSSRISDQLRLDVILTYPERIRGALNNPNVFIDVAVWYEDPVNGTHLYNGTKVRRDSSEQAQARITEKYASAMLLPSEAGVTKMYILASIVVPGGAPQGTVDQLEQLEFFCDVRVLPRS